MKGLRHPLESTLHMLETICSIEFLLDVKSIRFRHLVRKLASGEFQELDLSKTRKIFPNAVLHVAHNPHSDNPQSWCYRLFMGIPPLAEVLAKMVRGQDSPCKMVHNNVRFHDMYKPICKHWVKCWKRWGPLTRMSRTFHFTCDWMQKMWCSHDASTEEATSANEWAKWLELKHCVLTSFMAEASNQIVKCLPTWEPEHSHLASHTEAAWQLVGSMKQMFKEKKAGSGNTEAAFLINNLQQRDITFLFCDGSIKTLRIQDLTTELMDQCYDVMSHWVDLLEATIQAECPIWEMTKAFHWCSFTKRAEIIFHPATRALDSDDYEDPLNSKYIEVLARRVGCDKVDLQQQIALLKPWASHILDNGIGDPRTAWKLALVRKLDRVNGIKRDWQIFGKPSHVDDMHYELDAVLKWLQYYMAWYGHDDHHNATTTNTIADIQQANDELECNYIEDVVAEKLCKTAIELYLYAYVWKFERCDIASSKQLPTLICNQPQQFSMVQQIAAAIHNTKEQSVTPASLVEIVQSIGQPCNEATFQDTNHFGPHFRHNKWPKKIITDMHHRIKNGRSAKLNGHVRAKQLKCPISIHHFHKRAQPMQKH